MSDILFLAHRVPFPPNRGDKIRSANLLWRLARLANVHVGCFAENAEDRAGGKIVSELANSHCLINRNKPLVLAGIEALIASKPVSLTAFHSAQLESWVHQTIAQNDISTIVIFSGQMGQYVPADFPGRVIIDLCDVDSAKFENYAQAGQRVWLNNREGRLLAMEEQRLAQRADATLLISQAEADLFKSRLEKQDTANVQIIGNGIDAETFDPAKVEPHEEILLDQGPHFVFTGQMDYPPNESACLWAMDEFLPQIRKTYPQAQLHVVGRNPTARLKNRNGASGVRIWGEVADIKPFIASAHCILAPLLIARGVQNKVLEAMAMERPVLLTQQAATGIAAKDDEHWMLCPADGQAMAQRAQQLLENSEKAQVMGKAARQFVLAHHGWDAMLAPLEVLVRGDMQEPRHAA